MRLFFAALCEGFADGVILSDIFFVRNVNFNKKPPPFFDGL